VPGYAAMVVEASIRRQVAMTAVLVQACGLVEPSGGLEVRHSTTAVRDLVADLRARVEVVGPAPGDPSARAISRESADRRPFADERQVQEWWLAADRVLSATPSTDVLEGRDWEVRFVASLFGHRSQILAWAERIRPKWLTVRDWAPVLAALSRRAELGESLDVVSVCWDVQRASRVEGPGPGLVAVRGAVEASCWEDPDYLGRRVAANLLRRAAENAAASIRTAAANPGLTVHDVLATVEVMLDAIEWAAETLTVEPQPAAGSEPQPRAVIEPALDPQLRPPAELSPPAIGW